MRLTFTRIIDADGHIYEDEAGIFEHMDPAYRKMSERPGNRSAAGSPAFGESHANSSAPRQAAEGGPGGMAQLSRRSRDRMDRALPDPGPVLGQDRQSRLRRGRLPRLQRLAPRYLHQIQSAVPRHGDPSRCRIPKRP